jgi:hypothetical protein
VGVEHYIALFMGELTIARERFEQSLALFGPSDTSLSYFALPNGI